MPKFKINLKGEKALIKSLEQFPDKVQKTIMKSAIRKAAKPLVAQAKENTPVESGALKKSMKLRAIKRSRKNKYRVGFLIGSSDKNFTGEQYYGSFLEFGTKRQPPIGMVRKAYDSGGEAAMNAAIEEIKKGIEFEKWTISNEAKKGA